MLNREQEVLTLSSKIQNDVASSIAKTQRDFFLREQLRAIQRELGDSEPNAGETKNRCAKKLTRRFCPPKSAKPPSRNWNACSKRRPPPPNTASREIISTGFWRCRGKNPPRTNSI
jgi:ATP-dependent Lon protease